MVSRTNDATKEIIMHQSRVTDEQAARNLRRYLKKKAKNPAKAHPKQEKFTQNPRRMFSIGARLDENTFNQLCHLVGR